MNTIHITDCTGASPEHTLKHQLIAQGIIKDSTEWGPSNKDQYSVYNHFRHYAAQGYVPYGMCRALPNSHCGVCYHDTDYQYMFVSKTDEPFEVKWVDKDGNETLIVYPRVMYSGSECIHLADELKTLSVRCVKDYAISSITYTDGKIDAYDIVYNAHKWLVDHAVFPVDWFYFEPGLRNKLIWGQWKAGLGVHVYKAFDTESVVRGMSMAWRHYCKYRYEEDLWMKKRDNFVLKHLVRPTDIFDGKDKFGGFATRHTRQQVADPNKYVILTREQAIAIRTV